MKAAIIIFGLLALAEAQRQGRRIRVGRRQKSPELSYLAPLEPEAAPSDVKSSYLAPAPLPSEAVVVAARDSYGVPEADDEPLSGYGAARSDLPVEDYAAPPSDSYGAAASDVDYAAPLSDSYGAAAADDYAAPRVVEAPVENYGVPEEKAAAPSEVYNVAADVPPPVYGGAADLSSYNQLDAAASTRSEEEMGLKMLMGAVPGVPGEDYPIYAEIPDTGFSCDGQVDGGYYADSEAECQVFHICTADSEGGLAKYSFLCPNGTIFNQNYFICDWWFNFDCAEADSLASAKNGELASAREAGTAAAAERAAAAAASEANASYAAPATVVDIRTGYGSPAAEEESVVVEARGAADGYGAPSEIVETRAGYGAPAEERLAGYDDVPTYNGRL